MQRSKNWVNKETEFNIKISKNSNEDKFHIDILDEDFLQIYNSQSSIGDGNRNKFPLFVIDKTEKCMKCLEYNKVLSGYEGV